MLVPVLLFILGLVLLIKGGDWFVDGASGIAHRFRLPEILIGATVVSIGTTLPEVMVSSQAALSGHGEIAYGNAVGSVICNAALIAAITCAVRPQPVDRKSMKTPVIWFFSAAVLYAAAAYFYRFTRAVGLLFLAMFVAYMIVTVRQAFAEKRALEEEESTGSTRIEIVSEESEEPEDKPAVLDKILPDGPLKDVILLIVGAVLIAIGADLLVDNGTLIAKALGVPESVIALTFVALGTSLPELVTAITSLVKGHSSLSLGNVIGANLFNIVLVCGTAMTLNPFELPVEKTIGGMNASLLVDLPVMFAVMLILSIPSLRKGKITRAQGIALLAIYAAFVTFQFFG
ncbi:MAG: calcium/sodium antiporter [Firmicutes bacterium]|nr:calcium/sodium antiporter [Bacillota bacterium]